LTIAKFECRRTTWAKESWKLGDQTADALKAVAPAVERHARLGGDRHLGEAKRGGRLITLSCALEAGGVFCRIHFGRRHIREVGDKEIKVRWIPWGTARKKWFRKIAVQERHSRCNSRAKRVCARDCKRIPRKVGGGKAQRDG
jgi:hypothetical protein